MLFNSYSYEILYEQFHWIYLQGDIKLLLVAVNNRLKFEIEIVHDLSCHPIQANVWAVENGSRWRICCNARRWLQGLTAGMWLSNVKLLSMVTTSNGDCICSSSAWLRWRTEADSLRLVLSKSHILQKYSDIPLYRCLSWRHGPTIWNKFPTGFSGLGARVHTSGVTRVGVTQGRQLTVSSLFFSWKKNWQHFF